MGRGVGKPRFGRSCHPPIDFQIDVVAGIMVQTVNITLLMLTISNLVIEQIGLERRGSRSTREVFHAALLTWAFIFNRTIL